MKQEITKSDVRAARAALADVLDAEKAIEVAKACKLDCEEDDIRCQHLKTFLTNFLEVFGPQHPTH